MNEQLANLFFAFFQIGLFSIGGGYAVIPLIQEQVVNRSSWMTQQAFTDIITISQMTPGPLAVNTSTFVGIQIAGVPGAVAATVACVMSGVILSMALHSFFTKHRHNLYAFSVLQGLKSISLGLIGSAAMALLSSAFLIGEAVDWISIPLFLLALGSVRRFRINPILTMLLCGGAGLLLYRV